MKKGLVQFIKTLSLKNKLSFFFCMGLIPLTILLIYSLITMSRYNKHYDQIVKNITAANTYNLSFKENMDSTMYMIAIGGEKGSSNIKEITEGQDPYQQIEEVREVFKKLYKIASTDSSRRRISKIFKTLNTLEDRVDDIVENVKETGHYDENMNMLDMNIRILTKLIQDDIQEYIYYEASSLEDIRRDISLQADASIRITVVALSALVLLCIMISKIIARQITKPIDELCGLTKQFAKGDFSVQASVKSGDELEVLADSFNYMVNEIASLVEDTKEKEKNLRVTELKLLQAQINPHFLYNTLDTIVWLAEDKKNEQVVSMVSSLSDFFRTTLSKGKDFIRIEEEESHIRSYLEIQQVRYHDILDYEIDISEVVKNFLVLKLTLQPLVENALYHGIKKKRGLGKIKVKAVLEGTCIVMTVEDDGIGMGEQELEDLRRLIKGKLKHKMKKDDSNNGFGLVNVEQRIELMYGKEYGMQIDSREGEGTRVMVRIPAITESEKILTKE